jgi:hypothetical protein
MNEKVKIKNEKLKMEAVPCGLIRDSHFFTRGQD